MSNQNGNDKSKEDWMHLCELASKEHDPDKLMELVREITRLLEERERAAKTRNTVS